MDKARLVLGVIGSDVHVVANRILDRALTDGGFDVTNLGVMVAQDEFVAAAIETDASAILVGSLYGQGEMDCRGLRGKCEESGIGHILLYVGGNLAIGKHEWAEVKLKFEKLGFDRAFPPSTDPAEIVAALRQDLGRLAGGIGT